MRLTSRAAKGTLGPCSRGRSGCTWWGASRWAAPRRCSAASRRCSATGCGGSPTARPARARTGSAGSTPSSARSRSSSPASPGASLLLPRAAAAAPALRRGRGRHGLRRARLRLGGDVLARDLRAPDATRASSPRRCRFLVSLPTPLAPVSAFVALEHQADLEPVYEAQMAREVERILDAIPPADLAIQWDARYEFAMLDGAIAVWFGDVRAGILERLLRLGRHVPPEVELGYHLCYGDEEHGHFSEPQDSKDLVAVANALGDGLERPLKWIHMPVPQRARRRRLVRPDARAAAAAGDRALPRPPPPVRPRRGRAAPHRGRAPARAALRRRRPSAAGAAAAPRRCWGCSSCTAACRRRCPTPRRSAG